MCIRDSFSSLHAFLSHDGAPRLHPRRAVVVEIKIITIIHIIIASSSSSSAHPRPRARDARPLQAIIHVDRSTRASRDPLPSRSSPSSSKARAHEVDVHDEWLDASVESGRRGCEKDCSCSRGCASVYVVIDS